MRVTRITIDADLGIIELRTGPGGDGDYVLLPLELPPVAERYLRFPGDKAEAPEGDGLYRHDRGGIQYPTGGLVASGGWCVPKEQAYEPNGYTGMETNEVIPNCTCGYCRHKEGH